MESDEILKLCLITILILLPSVYATQFSSGNYTVDVVFNPSVLTDTTNFVFNPIVSNATKGYKYIVPSVSVITAAPGGRGFKKVSALYYDVIVDVHKDRYLIESNVTANITIINKGHVPDKDAVLTYYLKGPNGEIYDEHREYREEVLPTCDFGHYDDMIDMCVLNKYNYTANKWVQQRTLTLPLNTVSGQWRFMVEYDTDVQPLIQVWDSFEVYRKIYKGFLELFIIVTLIFMLEKNKADKERLEKKWRKKRYSS